MSDLGRIVERIPITSNGILLVQVAKRPPLLKPGQMTNFPEKRIDDAHSGTHELLIGEIGN